MKTVFVDTSGLYAFLDGSDRRHGDAVRIAKRLLDEDAEWVSHSFVLVELLALLQHRLGLKAVETFRQDIQSMMRLVWVDQPLFEQALHDLLIAGSRKLSLVDHVSFAVMRAEKIQDTFAFDEDFARAGFVLVK